ncbi:MAG: hydroxymethylbilane synthase [Oscillospiraceae bacterium]|nr:hydroxymethylbilane synthase [Oscillospiraceae bacterium]
MKIRIGTRASQLALAQTALVETALQKAGAETEIICISTRGDKIQQQSLAEISRSQTGVFVSEIEKALLQNQIDIAVHSAKDLPVKLADGLEIGAVLKRGNYHDVLVTNQNHDSLHTVGTGSLRRRLFFWKLYPDTEFRDIRGNIDTRLQKLRNHDYDGIILAAAGLERLHLLGHPDFRFQLFNISQMIPAACQGIIAVENRKHDSLHFLLKEITDTETKYCFETERHVLTLLCGDCSIPVSALAQVRNHQMELTVTKDCQNIQKKTALLEERFHLAEELIQNL